MNADSGLTSPRCKVDGGMTADNLLMQFLADVLDVPGGAPDGRRDGLARRGLRRRASPSGYWPDLEALRAQLAPGGAVAAGDGRRSVREPRVRQLAAGGRADLRLGDRPGGHPPAVIGAAAAVTVAAIAARCWRRINSDGSQRSAGRPTSSAPSPSGATASSVPSRSQSAGAQPAVGAALRAGRGGHHGTASCCELRRGAARGEHAGTSPSTGGVRAPAPSPPGRSRATPSAKHGQRFVGPGGQLVQQFQLAVRVDLARVGTDRLDLHPWDGHARR